MHLFFLVHGLFGSPGHMESIKKSIERATADLDEEVTAYCAKCMTPVGTFDGVRENGQRVLHELLIQLKETKATRLSIVGYSMGGLCSRYVVGELYERGVLDKIEPVLFTTFATPHVGSVYAYNTLFRYIFNGVGSNITGKTGFDLFRRTSLISDMADPNQKYMKGLKKFRSLSLFANTILDRSVHFWTSFLAPLNPFEHIDRVDLVMYEKYPYIVDLHKSKMSTAKNASERGHKRRLSTGTLLFRALIPLFLIILLTVMTSVTIISWTKKLFRIGHHRSAASDRLAEGLGEALMRDPDPEANDEVREEAKEVGEVTPVVGAEFPALFETAPKNLKLSKSELTDLENLNTLPWQKYAVLLHAANSHGEIVDRRNSGHEGKAIANFFAKKVVVPALRR